MTTESARGKTYTIKTLLSVLGISRNTLRYYEQIGVISPVRDPDSNYRVYTNDDVFSVAQLNMLKNAGFEVADVQVVMEKTEDASEFVGRLSEQNMRQAGMACRGPRLPGDASGYLRRYTSGPHAPSFRQSTGPFLFR